MEFAEKLNEYIVSQLLVEKGLDQIADDEDLLISGLIDSLGVVRLLTYLEQSLQVTIPPEDVTLENFQTIGNIVSYLQKFNAR
jgi:acyl carrier protein